MSCTEWVEGWIAVQSEDDLTNLVTGIDDKTVKFLDVIKALGPSLTSDDAIQRGRGVGLLSAVLQRCSSERLDKQAVRVLVTFYTQKLDDSETVIPGLKGLLSLAAHPTFSSSDAVEVFKALVANLRMKAHVQSTRYLVYQILDHLVSKHREALKPLRDEFLRGYISLVEGEKDPRNLLVIFTMDRVVLIEWNIEAYTEDFFDITFCYFPITFRPPPNDPYRISSEDLKTALRGCLRATPLFGPIGIPLFLEKLSAGTPPVRRDSLRTMSECLPVYGPGVTRQFASSIWNSVRVEIVQPSDTETQAAALEAAQAVISVAYQSSDGSTDGVAEDICKECMDILKEPEKNQAQGAVKLLSALLGTSAAVRRLVVTQTISKFVALFSDPKEASNKDHILGLLGSFLAAIRELYSGEGDGAPAVTEETRSIDQYRDQLIAVFTSGLKGVETRKAALHGVLQMIQIPQFLSEDEITFAVQQVDELLEPSHDLQDIRDAILNLLTTVSKIMPLIIERTTLPLLFSVLPEYAPAPDAKAERALYQRTLRWLATLCMPPNLFETLVVRVLTKLELLSSGLPEMAKSLAPDEVPVLFEHNAAYAYALLVTLDDAISSKIEQGANDIPKYLDRLVPRLFAIFVSTAIPSAPQPSLTSEVRLLKIVASIAQRIFRETSTSRQTTFVSGLLSSFETGTFSNSSVGLSWTAPTVQAAPFRPGSSETEKSLILLLDSPITTLRRDVALPVPDLSSWLQKMVHWGVNEAISAAQATSSFHIVASVINKHAEDAAGFLETSMQELWTGTIASTTALEVRRERGLKAWVLVTRALLVRGHKLATSCVENIFILLTDATLSLDAARAVGSLIAEDHVICKANFSTIKFLYAQKYAVTVLPRILTGYKESKEPSLQTSYLTALISLIKHLPQSVYADRVPSLMPLFILGLDLPDVDACANVIDTLTMIAKDDGPQKEALADHTTTLVTNLLRNALPQERSSTRLRIAALRCLGILPNAVKYEQLHSHKLHVLRQLLKALDDPKRDVRKMAVDTRAVWFVLNE